MPRKLTKSLKSKTVKKLPSNATDSLHRDPQHKEHDLQQRRYSKTKSIHTFIQSKHEDHQTIPMVSEDYRSSADYHPWKSEYQKIIIREKNIKPMIKNSYTSIDRLISHAVESVTTKTECCSLSIPAEVIKIETANTQQTSRLSLPIIIRHVRRDELMPSERPISPSVSIKTNLLPQSLQRKSIISVMSMCKTTSMPPFSSTTDQLLNQNSVSIIQPQSRRSVLNVLYEIVIPLTVHTSK